MYYSQQTIAIVRYHAITSRAWFLFISILNYLNLNLKEKSLAEALRVLLKKFIYKMPVAINVV